MASRNDVQSVFGFYENMGTAHRLGQLDEEAFHRTFGPAPADILSLGWWFICSRRNGCFRRQGEGAYFSEFEDLVRRIFEHEHAFRDEYKPNPLVRLLALPDLRYSDAAAWRLCEYLSQELSAGHLDVPLPDPASADRGDQRRVVANVIHVPSDLGLDPCAWLKHVQAAKRLQARLRLMGRSELENLLGVRRGAAWIHLGAGGR